MNTKTLPILALIIAAIIWGLTLPVLKFALNEVPPFSLALARFSLASFIALIFLEYKNLKLKDFAQIGIFALIGITLHIGLLLLGLNQTQAVDATLILSLSPILTSSLAHLILKEKINLVHKLGLGLGFLGIALYLVLPAILQTKTQIHLFGDLLVLGSVAAAAVYTIGSKELFRIYSPRSVSAVSFLIGAIGFIPGSIVESYRNPGWLNEITVTGILAIAFLGIFSSFTAYSLYEYGLQKVAVHIDATISYLSPIIAISVAAIFLKETVSALFFASLALVVIGVLLVTKGLHKHHPRHHHRV